MEVEQTEELDYIDVIGDSGSTFVDGRVSDDDDEEGLYYDMDESDDGKDSSSTPTSETLCNEDENDNLWEMNFAPMQRTLPPLSSSSSS